MGDKIDVLKIILTFLKGNKVFLLVVTSMIGGGMVGHLVPPLVEAKPIEVTVTAPKAVIIKQNCKRCDEEIKTLKIKIKDLKAEVISLKRWHGG